MQRSQRNVPLYLREARRAEEVEQEVLLLLKGQQEEELYLQGEQVGAGACVRGCVCVFMCV